MSPTPTGTPTPTTQLVPRQLWAWPTDSQDPSAGGGCRNFTLRAGGSLVFNGTSTMTLPSDIIYQPECSGPAFGSESAGANDSVQQYQIPFYASVTPLVYVVAATTFVAWFLLIMLFVVPGGYISVPGRRQSRTWPGGRGLWRIFTSRSSVVGFGTRPWLQKIAAILVVLALTTVSADTFKQARHQYVNGYINAVELRKTVTYSTEVRAIRVVSDLFLWLAQIQTLIRLFPRHKEKLIIKWVGFLLICLDIIFSSLNSFTIADRYEPRRYQDAIPALSYLFQLALSLLYGTWVVYYAVTKRRYAFYHPLMPNICLIALFSIIAVLVPVVFFLVDILQPDVGAWGDYFRWVAAAAASIIVWEWVERIEALERDEKKDGVLGREVFDEDEVLDHSAASDASSRTSMDQDHDNDTRPQYRKVGSRIGRIGTRTSRKIGNVWDKTFDHEPSQRLGEKQQSGFPKASAQLSNSNRELTSIVGAEPAQVASPIDRGQTTSTGSTVYAIHYHPVTLTPPLPALVSDDPEKQGDDKQHTQSSQPMRKPMPIWLIAANTFKRSRKSPPLEVKKIISLNGGSDIAGGTSEPNGLGSHNLRSFVFGGKKRHPMEAAQRSSEPTVIPAPPRGHTPWSPDALRHTPLHEMDIPGSSHEEDEPSSGPIAVEGSPTSPGAADSNASTDHHLPESSPVQSSSEGPQASLGVDESIAKSAAVPPDRSVRDI